MTPRRYDQAVQAWFGNTIVEIEPIRGLKRIKEFETALNEEIMGFKDRLEAGSFQPSSPEHLFTQSVNVVRLLKLCCPQLTDDLIEESTPKERLGVLEEATRLNGFGHLTIFFSAATLTEIGLRMRSMSTEIFMKELGTEAFEEALPLLESSATSLALGSLGETSNTN